MKDPTPEPVVTEPDSGGVGKVPIAVSEGDFSTPSKRKRTITRPRGLRTLEPPPAPATVAITPPVVEPNISVEIAPQQMVPAVAQPTPLVTEATPAAFPDTSSLFSDEPVIVADEPVFMDMDMDAAAELGAAPSAANESSAVDEFLAAPPTPQPETALTPAPDLIPGFGLSEMGAVSGEGDGAVENVAAAGQMRDAARSGEGHPAPIARSPSPAPAFDAPSYSAGPDHLSTDGVLSGVGSHLSSEPVAVSGHDSVDGISAEARTVPVPDPAPDVEFISGPIEVSEATPMRESLAAAPPNANVPPPRPTPPPVPPDAADAELSPLAQTLANMAETMQTELAGESAVDIDIADAPLVQLPAEALTPGAPAKATPPPLPGSQPFGDDRRAAVPSALARLPEALVERPRRPKRSKPWFEEVFDETYLRTLPFMTANQTLREVDFIESSLAIPKGGEVLDVGCGYGRHAIELVQRGLAVTGLDLSLPLLIRAADESQRRSVSVNFMHADMREMSFDRQFAGAYCMLTSFGYFDEESNLKVAEGIARALRPGSRFLIDVVNRDYLVGDLPARVWWEGDGCVVLEEVDFNFNTNRVLTHRSVVFEDGQQLEQEISVRVYSLHEMGKLLRQAGFRVLEVSGSIPTRGHFFGANSRNLLILAERRSD
jgi:SAM-dependent methyltransferase